MGLKNLIEVWTNAGSEPDDTRKAKGFEGKYHPPAGIFNWLFHKHSAAINEIQNDEVFTSQLSVERGGTGKATTTEAFASLVFRGSVKEDAMQNCNTLKESGIYRIYITSESIASTYGFPSRYGLLEVRSITGYISQSFYEVASFKVYTRFSSNGGSTWSSWKQLYDTTNKPTLGDLSGTLTIPNGGTGASTTSKARENLSLNLITLIGLKQIDITAGQETIDDIANALPQYSEIVYEVGSVNAKIYPSSYGVLRALKVNTTRTHFYFYLKGNNVVYFGNYDSSLTEPWKGWVTEYNSGNLPIPAYNHKTYELTNEDLNTIRGEDKAGFYLAAGNNTCTNTPLKAGTSFSLEVKRSAGTHYVQELQSANNGTFIRFYDGSTWHDWSCVYEENKPPFILGSYVGNGEEEQIITLPQTPKAIIITANGCFGDRSIGNDIYSAMVFQGQTAIASTKYYNLASLSGNELTVISYDTGSNGDICLNNSDITYNYIMFM